MQILYTDDLSIFRELTANREVDGRHVKKLVSAIKKNNLLRVNPILVDRKMNVIDGQHRLEACRILQEGIFYMIDEHVSQSDIATLNSNSNNWKPADYVNYHTIEKAPGFEKVSKLLSLFQWLNVSTAVELLSSDNRRKTAEIREGKIDTSNYENAVEICKAINAMKDDYPFTAGGKFIRVFRKLVESGLYDHAVFLDKLEGNRRSFVQCANSRQYIEMIEEIYNKWTTESKRVYFTRTIK